MPPAASGFNFHSQTGVWERDGRKTERQLSGRWRRVLRAVLARVTDSMLGAWIEARGVRGQGRGQKSEGRGQRSKDRRQRRAAGCYSVLRALPRTRREFRLSAVRVLHSSSKDRPRSFGRPRPLQFVRDWLQVGLAGIKDLLSFPLCLWFSIVGFSRIHLWRTPKPFLPQPLRCRGDATAPSPNPAPRSTRSRLP